MLLKKLQKLHERAAVGALLIMASAPSFAANDLRGMLGSIEGQVQSVGNFALTVLYVLGFILFGVGIFKFISNNPQETTGDKLKWIIVGTLLLGIGVLVQVMTSSADLGGPARGTINF